MSQDLNDSDQERLRTLTKRPVLFNEGSPYECSQKDIDDYINEQIGACAHWEAVGAFFPSTGRAGSLQMN